MDYSSKRSRCRHHRGASIPHCWLDRSYCLDEANGSHTKAKWVRQVQLRKSSSPALIADRSTFRADSSATHRRLVLCGGDRSETSFRQTASLEYLPASVGDR